MIKVDKEQEQKIFWSRRLRNFAVRHIDWLRIVLFEMSGTAMFAYGVLASTNFTLTYPIILGVFSSAFISLSLFIAIVWGGQFTGGHFNPAVTLGFMLKKEGRIPLGRGLIYMASQIIGAWLGALLAWVVSDIHNAPLISSLPWLYVFYAFLAEVVGTFIFVLFIMVATTTDTTFCSSTIQVYIFIPTILMIARQYSYRSQGLNPAFAVAFQFFYTAFNNQWFLWQYVWATFFGPFVGSFLAVMFFEYFYRKFIIIFKKRQEEDKNYVQAGDMTQMTNR